MLTGAEREEIERWKRANGLTKPPNPHLVAWQRMQRRLEELGVRDMTPVERPQPILPEIPGRKSGEQLAREVGHLSGNDRDDDD